MCVALLVSYYWYGYYNHWHWLAATHWHHPKGSARQRYGCHSVITFSYHVASSMPLAASTGGACATSSSVNSSGVSQQELPYRSMIRRSGVEAGRANKARRLEPFAGSFLEAAGA